MERANCNMMGQSLCSGLQPDLPLNWPDTASTLCLLLLSSALFCFPKGQSQPEQGCTPLGLTGKAKGSRAKQKLTGKAKGSG